VLSWPRITKVEPYIDSNGCNCQIKSRLDLLVTITPFVFRGHLDFQISFDDFNLHHNLFLIQLQDDEHRWIETEKVNNSQKSTVRSKLRQNTGLFT
jgi:hypothetical protein